MGAINARGGGLFLPDSTYLNACAGPRERKNPDRGREVFTEKEGGKRWGGGGLSTNRG